MESRDPKYLNLYRRELLFERRALIDVMNRIHNLPADISRIESIERASRYGVVGYRHRYTTDAPTPHMRAFSYANEINSSISNTLITLESEKIKLDRMLGCVDE